MIHTLGLTIELTAGGIQFSGCNSNGTVWDLDNNEIQTRPDVAMIIEAHNFFTWSARDTRIKDRQQAARGEAALATQLRTLTPQQAVDYINNNVTNLASAKEVLKIIARILIAQRDQIWPDMPE